MRVCFFGVGSIGLRHIRNLRSLLGENINITAVRTGKGRELCDCDSGLIDSVIYDNEKMASYYDAIFITNPTALHFNTLVENYNKSNAFFIEKPVFITGNENVGNLMGEDKRCYVACPLRYTKVISYIKDNIDFSKVYSVRCICSSFLPEWRSEVDYRKTYSSSLEKGGGVSIDLIHEWDYLTYLMGFPNDVKSIISKKSHLEIDSDDIAVYIAEYTNLIVELHLDYFGRTPIREIELFTKDDTIRCDLINGIVQYIKSERTINLKESRDEYQKKELVHFMKIVNREISSDNNLENACRTLRLARSVV